jgi:hypothetical protein
MKFRVKFDEDYEADNWEEVRRQLIEYLASCVSLDLLPSEFDVEEIKQ